MNSSNSKDWLIVNDKYTIIRQAYIILTSHLVVFGIAYCNAAYWEKLAFSEAGLFVAFLERIRNLFGLHIYNHLLTREKD